SATAQPPRSYLRFTPARSNAGFRTSTFLILAACCASFPEVVFGSSPTAANGKISARRAVTGGMGFTSRLRARLHPSRIPDRLLPVKRQFTSTARGIVHCLRDSVRRCGPKYDRRGGLTQEGMGPRSGSSRTPSVAVKPFLSASSGPLGAGVHGNCPRVQRSAANRNFALNDHQRPGPRAARHGR